MAQPVTFDEVIGLAHQPDRCSYLCRGCEREWPCDPAREHLLTSMNNDVVMLNVVMWGEFDHAAMGPLRSEPIEVLAERFLRWIPERRGGGRGGAEIG